MISREYGWLARQRYVGVTRPVGMDAGQRTQPFRGAAVPRRVRVRWDPGVTSFVNGTVQKERAEIDCSEIEFPFHVHEILQSLRIKRCLKHLFKHRQTYHILN